MADQPWTGKAFSALERNVIGQRLCCYCGACVAVCPRQAVQLDDHIPHLAGECSACGLCYLACPASFLPRDELMRMTFGRSEDGLEHCRAIVMARACDARTRERAQHGGLVTALLRHLMERGEIDGALVVGTAPETPFKPLPMLATTLEEIAASAGTKYALSPNLVALNDPRLSQVERLAIVGSPCHIRAVRKMQWAGLPRRIADRVHLTIGLCSMPQISYPSLRHCVEQWLQLEMEQIKRLEWETDGQIHAYTTDGRDIHIPMKKAFVFSHAACLACDDYSNDLADVTAGFVGGVAGWSTLYIRSEKGERVVNMANAAGALETRGLPRGGLPVISLDGPLLYLYVAALKADWLRGLAQIQVMHAIKERLVADKLRRRRGIPAIPAWPPDQVDVEKNSLAAETADQ